MASKQMEEIQRKLAVLAYPRASAPAQSLLFAGVERYRLLEWLFFRYATARISGPQGFGLEIEGFVCSCCCCGSVGSWATDRPSRSRTGRGTASTATRRTAGSSVRFRLHSFLGSNLEMLAPAFADDAMFGVLQTWRRLRISWVSRLQSTPRRFRSEE